MFRFIYAHSLIMQIRCFSLFRWMYRGQRLKFKHFPGPYLQPISKVGSSTFLPNTPLICLSLSLCS